MIDLAALKFILADGLQLLKLVGLITLPLAVATAFLIWHVGRRKARRHE